MVELVALLVTLIVLVGGTYVTLPMWRCGWFPVTTSHDPTVPNPPCNAFVRLIQRLPR